MEGGRDAGAKPRIGQEGRRALVQAAFCYAIWGVVPVYWKLFSAVPPLQALATRMVWSCAFSVVLCLAMRVRFLPLLHDRRAWATFGASSVLIAANWGVYIWASTSGHLLETSLGFFLSPLTSIVLGVVCFRERLTRAQKAATMLAACGALLFAATHGGSVWIALVLAATFSAYGAVKKRGGYDALPGMAVESLFAAVLGAGLFAVGWADPGFWELAHTAPDALALTSPAGIALLAVGTGVVTAGPLALYSAAANRAPLSLLGLLQYLSPTLVMLLAVTCFGELPDAWQLASFLLIWVGLAAVACETVRGREARSRSCRRGF